MLFVGLCVLLVVCCLVRVVFVFLALYLLYWCLLAVFVGGVWYCLVLGVVVVRLLLCGVVVVV